MSTELVEEELKPYLDTVLNVAIERSEYFRFLLLLVISVICLLEKPESLQICLVLVECLCNNNKAL